MKKKSSCSVICGNAIICGRAIAFTVSQRIAAIANGAVGSVFDLSQFLASGNDWVGAGAGQRETSQQVWGRSLH